MVSAEEERTHQDESKETVRVWGGWQFAVGRVDASGGKSGARRKCKAENTHSPKGGASLLSPKNSRSEGASCWGDGWGCVCVTRSFVGMLRTLLQISIRP